MDNKDISNISNLNKLKHDNKYYIKRLLNSPRILEYKKLIKQSGGSNLKYIYDKYKNQLNENNNNKYIRNSHKSRFSGSSGSSGSSKSSFTSRLKDKVNNRLTSYSNKLKEKKDKYVNIAKKKLEDKADEYMKKAEEKADEYIMKAEKKADEYIMKAEQKALSNKKSIKSGGSETMDNFNLSKYSYDLSRQYEKTFKNHFVDFVAHLQI